MSLVLKFCRNSARVFPEGGSMLRSASASAEPPEPVSDACTYPFRCSRMCSNPSEKHSFVPQPGVSEVGNTHESLLPHVWDHRCQCSLRLNVFNLSESLFIPMINSNPDLATGYFTGYVTEFFTLYSQVRTTGFGPEHTQGAFVSSDSRRTNFPREIIRTR